MKLSKEHNLERYIYICFTFGTAVLELFDITEARVIRAIALAMLGYVVFDNIYLKEDISKVGEDTQKSLLKLSEELRNHTQICHSYKEVMSIRFG